MAVKEIKTKNNQEAFKEIFDRINCDSGLIFVDTPEETRLIREIFRNFRKDDVNFWSVGYGMHKIKPKQIIDEFLPSSNDYLPENAKTGKNKNFDTRSNVLFALKVIEEECREKINADLVGTHKNIYVLRDADKFFTNPAVVRAIRDLVYLASTASATIILCGHGLSVIQDLEKDAVFVSLRYPTIDEIKRDLIPKIKIGIEENQNDPTIPEDYKIDPNFDEDEVARACVGLTEDQILNVLQYTITNDKKIDLAKILEEKKSIINKSEILEFWPCNDSIGDIGGFNELKDWIQEVKIVLKHPEEAKDFYADQPKGILLLGVQGSGKTAIAKATANELHTSLIKFDMSKIFAGLVGQSEGNMRRALKLLEAVGGVALMDEMDKALAGAGSSDKTDGGTTSRVIGTFITWLQEPHPGLFLIATANDITNLLRNHPELLRKGRFDEIWFSDAPNKEERKSIFNIHLKKRGRNPEKLDLEELAGIEYEDSSGTKFPYTGAEIEYAIIDAIRSKFAKGKGKVIKLNSEEDVTTSDIREKLEIIIPITNIGKEAVGKMREFAKKHARNVSRVETKNTVKTTGKIRKVSQQSNISINDFDL